MANSRQIHIRASVATDEKVRHLAERYRTISNVITVAVDRMYRAEIGAQTCPKCERISLCEMPHGAGVWDCMFCGYTEDQETKQQPPT